MERKTITITVHEWDTDFNTNLTDFIAHLKDLLAMVPPDKTAIIDFDRTGSDYDYSRGEMSVYYTREETDDEFRARQQSEMRSKSEREARERAELARLKSKYPDLA